MTAWPEVAARRALLVAMREAARRVRLPLGSRIWRGNAGSQAGSGIGSSIDFHDHRPYLPGDDPRSIDWLAYARSGNYTMKLYREEVSPRVDLAFDVSPSMAEGKGARALELLYLSVESALQTGASLRCHAVDGADVRPCPVESLLGGEIPPTAQPAAPPVLERVPWRSGSLRVWISDLLYPGSPEAALASLASSRGRGVVLAPFTSAESAPDWSGNIDLRDAENGARHLQHFSREALARYRDAYARHFALWANAAHRHGVAFARVAAEPPFHPAVQADALRSGALEAVA